MSDQNLADESYDSEDEDNDYEPSADENDSEVDDASDEESSSKPVDEVQNKNVVQHKEHLWAAFLTDTTKPNHSGENVDQSADKETSNRSNASADNERKSLKSDGDQPTQKILTYEFAGEEIKVLKSNAKEMPTHANEAIICAEKLENPSEQQIPSSSSASSTVADVSDVSKAKQAVKRPGGGLSGVLSQIDKKQKLSTLQKSQIDWASFKKAENLDEQLEQHNRGKYGFIERQEFLQRADYRQFENERSIRQSNKKS